MEKLKLNTKFQLYIINKYTRMYQNIYLQIVNIISFIYVQNKKRKKYTVVISSMLSHMYMHNDK
jgi:hypothetical protein